MFPLYLEKLSFGELQERSSQLKEKMSQCTLCPHACLAERAKGKIGVCRSTNEVFISSYGPHYGEEPPLVGAFGSGTIFFTGCNLHCVFCQNYDISQLRHGVKCSIGELAEIMLKLQSRGCHNINLVTPTHFISQIVEALIIAVEKGLEIPIVYNCGGYESVDTIKLLDGLIDIYMPDIKYSDDENAKKYSAAIDYWDAVTEAVKEMHRQVGDLHMSNRGIAQRGLIVRHLVLPDNIAGSKKIIDFVSGEISPNTYLNIMDQYHPSFKAYKYPALSRRISNDEYESVIEYAATTGIMRGFN
jgi:putative pyruvate formate lyase activating enzyme